MKAVNKILLVAGAGLAVFFGPTLIAAYSLTFDILNIVLTGAGNNKLKFFVTVRLKNPSWFKISMQYLKADIILDGQKIAQLDQAENTIILANSESNFNVEFQVDAQTVGAELMKQLMAQNLQNIVLNIRGTMTGNGKSIPFDMYKSLQYIIYGN